MPSVPSGPQTIFFIHSGDDLYGSDVVLLELVRGLDQTRFTPWVLLPSDTAHVGLLSAELRGAGIAYRHMPFPVLRRRYFTPLGGVRFLRETLTGLRQLRALAREQKAALIHTNTLAVPIGAFLARWTGLPHVWHVHEIITRPTLVRKALHWLVARWSDTGICISEAVRAHVARDEPDARLRIVPNGIRTPAFSTESPRSIKTSLGMSPDVPLIGMMGRISAWKGQPVLARAAALIQQSGHAAQFLVMGGVFDGNLQPLNELTALVRELGIEDIFLIRDFHPNARALLPAFDIFVLPSVLPEPFGLVVTEAMAAGCPVVATNHGGPREIVVNGETGLLVTPDDPAALADALVLLLQDGPGRRVMGEKGRQRMLSHFGLERFITCISSVYDEVLCRR